MITFVCPACNRTLSVPDTLGGKKARCPGCKATTTIPTSEALTLPPPDDQATLPPPDDLATLPPPSSNAVAPQPTTQVIAGYEILGELGRGGMGVVYKARQHKPRRVVALKMILAGEHASSDALQRFQAEAEAVAKLQHPSIVRIHEVGEHNGHPFFSLEFVEGGSLQGLMRTRRFASVETAEMLLQLARGVDYAHKHGIVHRDLKPANILLAKEENEEEDQPPRWIPKITDFGLAKQMDDMASVAPAGPKTASGAIMGTPAYMSPEQAAGKVKQVGPASDVYSLGAILYEMLTGKPPFEAPSMLDTLIKVATEEPPPPRQVNPRIPRDLETICLKCMRKDPASRYSSAGALADDLRQYLDGKPIKARPQGTIESVGRWISRHKGLMIAGLCTLFAAGISLVILFFWARQRSPVDDVAESAITSDTQLIPRKSFAVLSLRVAEAWQRPDLREMVKELRLVSLLFGSKDDLDTLGQKMKKEVGLTPEDIERATIVWPTQNSTIGLFMPARGGKRQDLAVLIVTTTKAFDFKTLRKGLEPLTGSLVRKDHKHWKLYLSGTKEDGLCLCPVTDRILVAGMAGEVKKLLDQSSKESTGDLDEAVELIEQGKIFVGATRVPTELIEEMVRDKTRFPEGEKLRVFSSTKVALATLSLPSPTKGRWLPDLDLTTSLTFDTPDNATRGLPLLKTVASRILGEIKAEADRETFGELVAPFYRVIMAATWTQEGNSLRLPIKARWQDKTQQELNAWVREMGLRPESTKNLRAIGVALQNYAKNHNNTFPPAVITSADGKPLYSWRVALMPYLDMGEEFEQLHKGRAWDSPANKKILAKMPAVFVAPGRKNDGTTYYQAVVGDGGLNREDPIQMTAFKDGISNCLLVVEGREAVPWAAPRDVAFVKGKKFAAGGGLFKKGFHGLYADGYTGRFIPTTTPQEVVEALATRAGGESVDRWGLRLNPPRKQ